MRSSFWKLLVLLAVLLAFAFAIYRFGGTLQGASFSASKLWLAVRSANRYLLLASVLAIYGCYAIRAARWGVFQQNLGASNFWAIYEMTLGGFAAVFLLGRAGEPVRPLLLARKEKLPLADMYGIYALERVFDVVSAAVIAGVALLVERRHVPVANATGSILIGGVAGVIGFLAYFRLHGTAALERSLKGWRESHGWRTKFAGTVLGFARGVQIIRSWGELALTSLLSAAHWGLVFLVYVWITRSFGGRFEELTVADALLLMAFTLAGSVFQLPLAGGGSQLAAISAYKFFGIENEPATAAAVVLWLITFAACSLVGVPLLIHEGFSIGKLKQMAEGEKEAAAG
ncbi:MAG TPA: lysylphosphatidylglycerol synthase transmembrane domain-containing protein [Candidatus Methylomirabilis sp.]|nr:lysylphosphatidylglycerol synthase transmembrane domain-containing protein [Candidatus Methylomirabilis sp.]